MVHSGPFNGLCEIESSRGSPGISNIFLPMLQLLRTISPLPPPFVSSYLYPLPQTLAHLLPLTLLSDEGSAPDPRRHDLVTSRRRFAANASGFSSFCNRESTNLDVRARDVARILSSTYRIFLT